MKGEQIMKEVVALDLIKPGEQKIYIKDGSAQTVGELIELLSAIPKDYELSLSGMSEYTIAVDDESKAILIDDAKWIDEHVCTLNEERE